MKPQQQPLEGETNGWWIVPALFLLVIGFRASGLKIHDIMSGLGGAFLSTTIFVGGFFQRRKLAEARGVTAHPDDEGEWRAGTRAIATIVLVITLVAPEAAWVVLGLGVLQLILNWLFVR